MEWRFPALDQRSLILGSTGQGKTAMGLWLLKYAPFHIQPYIMVDYKREKQIKAIDRAREIGLNELPVYPGLYVVRPMLDIDDDRMINFLRAIHRRGNIGIYFDEALSVPQSGGALQAVYTQGRSLNIPIIALSQRPVDLHRTMLSEADHLSVFHLNDSRDYLTVKKYIPRFSADTVESLPPYNSIWYTQAGRKTASLAPVPYDTLTQDINARLPARVYFL